MKPRLTQRRTLAALDKTSKLFEIPPRDIVGGRYRRLELITMARQALCAALYNNTATTMHELGKLLGRDHTTVLYHVRQAEARARTDAEYADAIAQIAGVCR